jgi:hypothetical protein
MHSAHRTAPRVRARETSPRSHAPGILVLLGALAVCPTGGMTAAPLAPPSCTVDGRPGPMLASIRPDYRSYIGALRQLDPPARVAARAGHEARRIYMALVRPGASSPDASDSAPFIGPGIRNDVLYDPVSIGTARSAAWSLLLLDHEYFHARHLAGATSLPLPGIVPGEVERHFYEAAAWGFNVAEARAGRYPGLRPDEFREALDQYGAHYEALRDLMKETSGGRWLAFDEMLRKPAELVTPPTAPARAAAVATNARFPLATMIGTRPSEGPARPSDSGPSPAIP